MTALTYALTGLAIYAALLLAIGWASRADAQYTGYVIGNRRVGVIGTSASQVVSIFDGTGLVILLTLGAQFGFGLMWGTLGIAAANVLLALQAARIRTQAGARGYVTISDMLADRIGPKACTVSALLIAVALVLSLGGSLHIVGKMAAAATGVGQTIAIVATSAVVALYMLIGGYMSVIRTDIMQAAIIVLLCLCAYLFGAYPAPEAAWQAFSGMDFAQGPGLFLLLLALNYGFIDSWQRLFSARSPEIARKATWLTALVNLVLYTAPVILAAGLIRAHPDIPANEFVFKSLSDPAIFPAIGGAFAVALMVLVMSSMDSRAYVAASTIAANLFRLDPEVRRDRFVRCLRILFVVIFAGISITAITITDFIDFMVNVASLLTIFAPLFFVSVYYRPRALRRYDIASCVIMLAGAAIWIVMFAGGYFSTFITNVIPVGVVAALVVLNSGIDRLIAQRQTA